MLCLTKFRSWISLHFLHDIAKRYPDAQRITLVMDSLSTPRPGALYESSSSGQGSVGARQVRLTPSTAIGSTWWRSDGMP